MSRVYQCDVCGNVRDRGSISKFYKKGISLSSRTYEEKIKKSFHICDKCVDKIVRILRTEQDEWIAVEDRLPEEGKLVLVTIISNASTKRVTIGYVTMARDDNDVLYGEWFDELYCEIEGVVAWKPLSEPYSESKSFVKNVAEPFSKGMQDGMERKPLAVNMKGEETECGLVLTGELTPEGEEFFKELEQQQTKEVMKSECY